MENEKLKTLKERYKKEGFIIVGIVGSYARGEATSKSDIDILYEIDYKNFLNNYDGFKSFKRLEEIKNELTAVFGKNVDLINKKTLNEIGQKYILKDVIYVR